MNAVTAARAALAMVPEAPGRHCPASYGYRPEVFRRAPEIVTDTLYVAGGLYGNLLALDRIEELARDEARPAAADAGNTSMSGVASAAGASCAASGPTLVFNGDFHWFDVDARVFGEVNARIMQHTALRGNVETELAGDDNAAGCGCGYPDDVPDAEVERSNRIIARLRATARIDPQTRSLLGSLPMHAVALVGNARVGIVHGDAQALGGWAFAADRLREPAAQAGLASILRRANIDVFASSHTCLPALHRIGVDGRQCAIVNNGAAGMPNFAGVRAGLISRIALTRPPAWMPVVHETVLEVAGSPLYLSAIEVGYDHHAWRLHFLQNWPAGSPAHDAYFQRIEHGPTYTPHQAYS